MKKSLVLLYISLALWTVRAGESKGIANSVFDTDGAVLPASHLTRRQAIEEALAHNPEIAAGRMQAVAARVRSSIATAIIA